MFLGRFERFVASRYIFGLKSSGFTSVVAAFSFFGIVIGVAALIVVTSVMNGFRSNILARITGLNGHVALFSPRARSLSLSLVKVLEKGKGVRQVIPVIEGQVIASAGRATRGVFLRGIRQEDIFKHALLKKSLVQGSLMFPPEEEGIGNLIPCIVGERFLAKMGLGIGDTFSVLVLQGTPSILGRLPLMRRVRITGVFDVGMGEYDNAFIFIPFARAQALFHIPEEKMTSADIYLKEAMYTNDFIASLDKNSMRGFEFLDWKAANSQFFNVIEIERNVMFIILSLIVLVAAFNIVSSLVMLVKDKTRAIAIFRSMGSSRGAIRRIFLLAGLSIGTSGAIIGGGVGLLIARYIENIRQFFQTLLGVQLFPQDFYFLAQVPVEIVPKQVIFVMVFAILLSFFASLYPAFSASRMQPVEGLSWR